MAEQDYEPNQEEQELAGATVEDYMKIMRSEEQEFRENYEARLRMNNGTVIPVQDVNDHLRIVKRQVEFCRRYGSRIPCYNIGGKLVPFHWGQEANDFWNRLNFLRYRDYINFYPYLNTREFLYFIDSFVQNEKPEGLSMAEPGNFFEDLSGNLLDFLTARIVGINRWLREMGARLGRDGGGGGSTGGVGGGGAGGAGGGPTIHYATITVSTINAGLRLQVAPNFSMAWSHFGHPTSPVTGQLYPGKYHFGGDGPSVPSFKYDTVPVDIPPNLTPSLNVI